MRSETKLKVGIIGADPSRKDGWHTMTLGIIEGLDDLGLPYEVVHSGRNSDGLMAFGDISRLKFWVSVIYDTFILVKTLRASKISHFIVIPEYHCFSAFFASRVLGCAVIVYGAGTYSLRVFKSSSTLVRAIRRKVSWAVMSSYTLRRISAYDEIPLVKVVGAAPTKRFRSLALGVGRGEKVFDFIFVGNLKPRKGIFEFASAVSCLKQRLPDRVFSICMPGGYNEDEQDAIRRLLPGMFIEFPGIVDDAKLAKLYSMARINVLLSRDKDDHFEGYGLVHREALVCGTFSIGSVDSGNEDAILKPFGLVVDPADPEGVAEAFVRVLLEQPIVPLGAGSESWSHVVERMIDG